MSQSIITRAFETYKAQQEAILAPVELNEFVLALIPNQDPNQPIDKDEGLPHEHHIVHVSDVTQDGFVNPNAVIYSLIMDTRIGDFDFNWVGLRNKESGVLAAILHIPTIAKIKSIPGVQNGNSVTRSILMNYQDAKNATGITVDASSWQIDFTARLFGIDETERLNNIDVFGDAAFFNDGFQVKRTNDHYIACAGIGYVGGLRCYLENELSVLDVVNSSAIYIDVHRQGQLTSQWQTVFTIKNSPTELNDYIDEHGYPHFVTKIAEIDASGHIVDTRHRNGFAEYVRHDEHATKAEAEEMASPYKWLSALRFKDAFLSKLNNTVTSTSTEEALTANTGKTIWDRACEALNVAHSKWTYVQASLTTYGATKLSSAINSTSESLSATPKAVKLVADIANSKMTQATADSRYVSKSQVSSSTTSTSPTDVASSAGLKAAMDRANAAYNKADTSGNKVYSGTDENNTDFPVGTQVCAGVGSKVPKRNQHTRIYLTPAGTSNLFGTDLWGGSKVAYLSGTWSVKGMTYNTAGINARLFQRVL